MEWIDYSKEKPSKRDSYLVWLGFGFWCETLWDGFGFGEDIDEQVKYWMGIVPPAPGLESKSPVQGDVIVAAIVADDCTVDVRRAPRED